MEVNDNQAGMDGVSEEIALYILENTNDAVYIFNKDLQFTYWNPGMECLSGYSKEESLGKRLDELFPFVRTSGKLDILKRVLQGEKFSLINQYGCMQNTSEYFNGKYLPLRNSAGAITGGLGILQKTTPLVTAGQALSQAENRYADLVEKAPLSIAVFTETEILYGNSKLQEMLRVKDKKELLGRSPLFFVADSSKKAAENDLEAILSGKLMEPVKHTLLRLDGSTFLAEATFIPITYLGKKAIQAIIQDITLENQTFQELLNYKQLLSEVQRMARMGSYQFNLADESIYWSEGIFEIFGLDKNSFKPNLGSYLDLVVEPEVKQEITRYVRAVQLGADKEKAFLHSIQLSNGEKKFVRFIAKVVKESGTSTRQVVGSLQDVTEQRNMEEALSRANQILNMHFENSPLAIIQLDSAFNISSWSKQAEKLFGWKSNEVIGKCLLDINLIHQDHLPAIDQVIRELQNIVPNYRKGTLKFQTRKKTLLYCELFLSTITTDNNNIHSVFILLNDITSRTLAEQARVEGQFEERRRIARDIHDGIGQMLVAMKYKLTEFEELVPPDVLHKVEALELMLEQTLEEVRGISRNLGARSAVSLGLETSLRQLCDQMRKLTNIDLKFRYIGGEQEVNHKIVNALYRITQEASQNIIKHAQATKATIQVLKGKNFIELKIEDNGKGIPENGNQGQGLKNIEERVKLLGGNFQVSSEQNMGTTLMVTIPLETVEIEN